MINQYDIQCSRCCGTFLQTNAKFDPSFVTGDMIELKPEFNGLSFSKMQCPTCGNDICGKDGRVKRLVLVGEIDLAEITAKEMFRRAVITKKALADSADLELFGHVHCGECGEFSSVNYDDICEECANKSYGSIGQRGHCNLTRTTPKPKLYTKKELAQAVGCSESSVSSKRKKLSKWMTKDGNKNLYSEKAVKYLKGE